MPRSQAALDAIAAAADTAALKAARSAHTAEGSPLAQLNARLRDVAPDRKAEFGKLVGQARGRVNQALAAREAGARRGRDRRAARGGARRHHGAPRARARRGAASDLAPAGAGRRHLRRHGVGDRGGSRARARVVQLRRAQLRRRSPGAPDAGHVLRRPGRPSPRDAHAHEPRAGALDARARGADLRAVPGAGLPHRRVRRDAPAGLHPVRGARRRQGHHDGAPKGTLDHAARVLFGPEAKTRFRANYFPFTEPSRRARPLAPDLQGRRALDRVGRLRHGQPERAARGRASTPRSTRASRSGWASSGR